MKTFGKTLAAALLLIAAFSGNNVTGQFQPEINIAITGTNQLSIVIKNPLTSTNYELYQRTLLDPLYPWTLKSIGNTGQTNFTVAIETTTVGFFQVGIGNDWDL